MALGRPGHRRRAMLAVVVLLGLVAGHAAAQTEFVPSAGAASHAGRQPAHARPARAATPAKPAAVARTAIPIPPVPPPPPSLPPPIAVPVRPQPPTLPPTVMLNAPGEATAGKGSLRLTFGPDSAVLNPATDAAVRALVHGPSRAAGTDFTVAAYAAGAPDDPSAARRLSLSRALAVRSVLINEGVTSVHIYVKALGAPPAEDKPADRVDVTTNQNVPATKPSQ